MINQKILNLCVDQLSEIYNTPVRIHSTSSVGGGCINHAMKLSASVGDFFLKWNQHVPADIFEREAEGLKEMGEEGASSLVIPKVFWCKSVDHLPGLLLMEFLQPAQNTKGYDEQLGRGIARLHRKTADFYGFKHDNYCGTTLQDNTLTASWPEFYAYRRIAALIQKIKHVRGISSDELFIYEKLIDRIPEILSHATQPSLIHGDLWSGNYLFTSKGPALIDPACYYADREMELGMMQLFGGFSPEVWKAYQNEYPLPDDWQERLPLYQLYHLLNHYLLFGGSYGSESLRIAKRYVH